jgi:hypothetical protein
VLFARSGANYLEYQRVYGINFWEVRWSMPSSMQLSRSS